MNCERCEGLMLQDDFLDMQETGGMWLYGALLMSSQRVLEESTPENNQKVIGVMAA